VPCNCKADPNLRAVICNAKLEQGTSQDHKTNTPKAVSDIGRNLRRHILVARNRDLQGLASRSNSGRVPKRSWSAHFDRGLTPHGWGTMQVGDHNPTSKSARVQRVQPPCEKLFMNTNPHATNESWCLTRDYFEQAVRSIYTGATFWAATHLSMFVEAACWKAAANNSISPFLPTQCSLLQAQWYLNFGS
jgi:hypothetical protein